MMNVWCFGGHDVEVSTQFNLERVEPAVLPVRHGKQSIASFNSMT